MLDLLVNSSIRISLIHSSWVPAFFTVIRRSRYTHTAPEHLINRLTARNMHLLALRISEHLHIPPDGVLRHWAVAKIKQSSSKAGAATAVGGDDDDAAVCRMIVEKFQQGGGGGAGRRSVVSYAEIAKKAWESGRANLATMVSHTYISILGVRRQTLIGGVLFCLFLCVKTVAGSRAESC